MSAYISPCGKYRYRFNEEAAEIRLEEHREKNF